jgi:hypothetical protein
LGNGPFLSECFQLFVLVVVDCGVGEVEHAAFAGGGFGELVEGLVF